MNDENKSENAQKVYSILCAVLDEQGLEYKKFEEDLVVTFTLSGKLPMQCVIKIDCERQVIRFISPLPAVFEGDRRLTGAIATSQVNSRLKEGSFEFDYEKGKILFRMASSFNESEISKAVFRNMLEIAQFTMDTQNLRFDKLAAGQTSLEEFLNTFKK